MILKKCSKCKIVKDLSDFGRDSRYSDNKYPSCKACKSSVNRRRYIDKKDEIITKQVAYRKKRYKEDASYREYHKKQARSHYIKEIDRYREYHRTYVKDRTAKDVCFRIASRIRGRVQSAIKNNQKAGSAIKDLGCSIEDLKKHLESQFQPGMTWDNWSKDGWHIDHIKPLSAFDLSNPEQFKKACHYTNLQPLWAKDNLSKGSKLPEDI